MDKLSIEREVAGIRTALEKAQVRDEMLNYSLAYLLFLKRFIDQRQWHRDDDLHLVTSRRLSDFSWERVARAEDPASEIREVFAAIEDLVRPLEGLSKFNALVYSLESATRAKMATGAIFYAISALDLGSVTPAEMVAVFQRVLDVPVRHAASGTTPAPVRELIATLMGNEPVRSIYDPAVGTASLIGAVADRLRAGATGPTLFGQEIGIDLVNLAKIRAFLGEHAFDFRPGNTLLESKLTGDGKVYDLVVAHPPFGRIESEVTSDREFEKFDLAGAPTYEAAFLRHAIKSMSNKGHAAIVVPTGLLSRSADRSVREELVRDGLLDAVLSLPPFLFSGTDIAASVLLLRGSAIRERRGVVFVDLGTRIEGQKTRPTLSESGIADAAAAVRNRTNEVGFSGVAPEQNIEECDFDFSVGRYVRRLEEDAISLAENVARFSEAINRRSEAERKAIALLAALSDRKNSTKKEQ
jgi:hypothetical protein